MSPEEDKSIVRLDLDKLRFDPENPRLPYNNHSDSEEEILTWMLDNGSILELMGSIIENGFFPGEPLLVYQPEGKNFYEVIEGNRRLAALKLLNDPASAPIKKNSILAIHREKHNSVDQVPVIIFTKRDHVLDYLGYRHITGIKEWDPLQKAGYLDQLFKKESDDLTTDEKYYILAKKIGSTREYVGRLLTGLSIINKLSEEDFYETGISDESDISFSILTTALSNPAYVRFLNISSKTDRTLKDLDENNLEELISWMFKKGPDGKTRLKESRNLSKLGKVLDNDEALESFREGATIEEAILMTDEPDNIFLSSLMSTKNELIHAKSYTHLLNNPDYGHIIELIKSIKNLINELESIIKGKESGE
ncbi:MAG: ParB N-terminal domain-containing protein [Balneola sp.]|nr:ParB N-terminal domain-containing protein [Balneola sp.]